MTDSEIDAALTLAGHAQDRAVRSVFMRDAREDVPALADLIRRLALEVKALRAVLSDACSESAMYERGVRDALTALERMTCLYPLMADPLGVVGKSSALAAVRALLTP